MSDGVASLVVAIDGPSGSGKSTVARTVASRKGMRYLDTGAMYRAITWLALDRRVSLDDTAAVAELASGADLNITTAPEAPGIAAAGTDVTELVRGPEVTAAVSQVSANARVRAAMVARQRELIGDGGIVVEGRDIGTTVAPDAAVKVFLTARADQRAHRRSLQPEAAGSDAAVAQQAIERRDAADSTRQASPLVQAPDALLIDSSDLDVEGVVAQVMSAVEAAVGAQAPRP